MSATLRSFPALGKGLFVAIAGGFLAHYSAPLRNILGLVAARAIPRPWTLLTCAFLHDNAVTALAFAVAVLFLTRIVEPNYGAKALVKFLVFVLILTSFLTVAVVTIAYYATLTKASHKADHAGMALFRPMGGFEAGVAALLVSVKQLIPDNEVSLLGGALKFRAKHLPALFAVTMVVGSLILGDAIRVIPFTLFGTYLSWAFLRFVQTRNGIRGDLSDEFRLASFFPQPVQPAIDTVAGFCTKLTGLGASSGGQPQHAAFNYGMGGAVLPGGAMLPGTEAGDAARRRERGAKALEERLGLKKAASAASTGPTDGTASQGAESQAGMVQTDVEAAGPEGSA